MAVGGWPGTDDPARPDLYVPRGGAAVFRRVVGSWGNEDLIEKAFALHEYAAPRRADRGAAADALLRGPALPGHHAVELASNGSRFTFGADCKPNEELILFAQDTDVLMIEATLPRPERTGVRGHLTPREAGEHGRRARARGSC